MKTSIVGGHVVDTPARELTDAELHRITTDLAEREIYVTPVTDIYHVLHLWARDVLTTVQEVAMLAEFLACTDCRLDYHKAVAS